MPETLNKASKHQAIGGVFSDRANAEKAIQAFLDMGILEQNIHMVVSLYDQARDGKTLVTVHHVTDPSAVIEIFDDNKADYNLDGSRNLRQDVAGLTVGALAGAFVGALAGGATGTVLAGAAGTFIGAVAGSMVGGCVGAGVGKLVEHLK